MREEAYERYVQNAEETLAAKASMAAGASTGDFVPPRGPFWRGRAWVKHYLPSGTSGSENETYNILYEDLEVSDDTDSDYSASSGPDDSSKHNKKNDMEPDGPKRKYPKLWELAKAEGDRDFIDWLGKHIWTYVGLAAPLLGAPGPLRSVLSGENMGLPFTDEEARALELCTLEVILSRLFISFVYLTLGRH